MTRASAPSPTVVKRIRGRQGVENGDNAGGRGLQELVVDKTNFQNPFLLVDGVREFWLSGTLMIAYLVYVTAVTIGMGNVMVLMPNLRPIDQVPKTSQQFVLF